MKEMYFGWDYEKVDEILEKPETEIIGREGGAGTDYEFIIAFNYKEKKVYIAICNDANAGWSVYEFNLYEDYEEFIEFLADALENEAFRDAVVKAICRLHELGYI